VGATGDSLQETSQGLCCAGSPGALSMVRCSLVWPISDGHVHTWKQTPNPSGTSSRPVSQRTIPWAVLMQQENAQAEFWAT